MDSHREPGAHHSFPRFYPHVTLATIKPAASATTTPTSSEAHPTATSEPGYTSSREKAAALLALREAMPLGQTAVDVRFGRLIAGDDYYRSVYVALLLSRELVELRAALSAALGSPGPGPPAFPHLSLYYIADEDAHARTRVMQELERENVVAPSADERGIVLRCGSGPDGPVTLDGFTGTQLWMVDCEGPVEEWEVLDKILLAEPDL